MRKGREGVDQIASKGFQNPLGGFCIFVGHPMAAEGFKRKLTVVFSADIAGYSRLMGEDRE